MTSVAAAAVTAAAVVAWSGALDRSYTVDAVLVRHGADGRTTPLSDGDRLALGDALSLELQTSRPVHVYVLNQDERGRAHVLFPRDNLDPVNPLRSGVRHRLPGTFAGRPTAWQVDTTGIREHLLIVVSPSAVGELETEIAKLSSATLASGGSGSAVVAPQGVAELRGIGGMIVLSDAGPEGTVGRMFDVANRLSNRPELAQGVWTRTIRLENRPP